MAWAKAWSVAEWEGRRFRGRGVAKEVPTWAAELTRELQTPGEEYFQEHEDDADQRDSVDQNPCGQGECDSAQRDGVEHCDRERNEYAAEQQRGSGAQCSCVNDGGGSAAVDAAEGELASGSFGVLSEAEVETELRGHVFGILEGWDLSMAPFVDPSYERFSGAVSARLVAMGVARSPWAEGAVWAFAAQFVGERG